jgi:ribose transport system ATP-binding protein
MAESEGSPLGAPLLTMRGVHKRFGPTTALKSVDLTLFGGEVLALIGENGAGKSTLMKVLSGAHVADAGEMTFGGKPYLPGNPLAARQAGVAMIYQELSIAPHLSVMENILLGVEPGKGPMVSWPQMRDRARQALREVGRSDIDPGTLAGRLSIAEQQLVEIARSVALGCRVLVLDEPTSSLTRRDIENLFAMLRRLRAQGLGIVYISHFLEEVRAISDRFTVLRDGSSVGEGKTAAVTDEEIIRLMVGRSVEDLYPRGDHHRGEVVLSVEKLAGVSKPLSATLELHRGEVFGIAGLIGAGRTELLRTIFGLDPVKSGDISVLMHRGPAAPAARWEQGVGMVSEDRKSEGLALQMSIADNVTLSNPHGLGPMGLVFPSRQDKATLPWIGKLSIKCASPRQNVGNLSGGNQQKVAIARLLHHHCDVLLLDEPTRGVDIGAKAQIYQLINELAVGDAASGRKPCAILVVSSYLPELLGVCDRIAVMSRGVLGAARPVQEWNAHTLMVEAVGQEMQRVENRS